MKRLVALCILSVMSLLIFSANAAPLKPPRGQIFDELRRTSGEKQQNEVEGLIHKSSLNLKEIFAASPIIYFLLLCMSVGSMIIWLYTLLTLRTKRILSPHFFDELQQQLSSQNYDIATELCMNNKSLLANMIQSGIRSKNHGPEFMVETIKSEGTREATHFWQRITLLNDIVIIAPMLGLLGTVLGMFYAFYDVNRSAESISALFDGLGIAVGTTVAGLIVAIIAMIFHTTLKYRLIKVLNLIENKAMSLSTLIKHEDKI